MRRRHISPSAYNFSLESPPLPGSVRAYEKWAAEERTKQPAAPYYETQTPRAGIGNHQTSVMENTRKNWSFEAQSARRHVEQLAVLQEQQQQAAQAEVERAQLAINTEREHRNREDAPMWFRKYWAEYPTNNIHNLRQYAYARGYVSHPTRATGEPMNRANTECNTKSFHDWCDPSGTTWAQYLAAGGK